MENNNKEAALNTVSLDTQTREENINSFTEEGSAKTEKSM
jgi:hypothetical protein